VNSIYFRVVRTMPELPEVETTRRGIEPHVKNHCIEAVDIYCKKLRYPIPQNLSKNLVGNSFVEVTRRGKYLLLVSNTGTLMIHLGMSGNLLLVDAGTALKKHDHLDISLKNGLCLRYHDPRRFGMVLWVATALWRHRLLKDLGPEPLPELSEKQFMNTQMIDAKCAEYFFRDVFNAEYLYQTSRGRRVSIKQFIMDSHVVVGVGNIYASEALFIAGIHPGRAAGRVAQLRYQRLAAAIKQVLSDAIKSGGTTLRDFYHGKDGRPGYFQQKLHVYGRQSQPCYVCQRPIKLLRQGQRSSYYCPTCQR